MSASRSSPYPWPESWCVVVMAQHSIAFTARPPREVSLYLLIMSAPV
ncbi:hypothetical protein BJ956_000710 [Arthrobacter psychrochitiniphilus]|nr:hypothetical protein [Arthrobacter psychrochitiniphilus]